MTSKQETADVRVRVYRSTRNCFLQDNLGWHASGSLQRMEWRIRDGKLATPQNIGRTLRELENEGKVQVEQTTLGIQRSHACGC